jgi:hypothetical protein
MSAGALRGTLVGACSALVTAAAHAAAAAGGSVLGSPLLMLALLCGTVGAAVTTVRVEGRAAEVLTLAAALGLAQAIGHVTLAAAAHHGGHGSAPTPLMLSAHLLATVGLAALIALTEYLYAVCGSVLCWLHLFVRPRGRPRLRRALISRPVLVARPVLLRSGLGMRAPPRGAVICG